MSFTTDIFDSIAEDIQSNPIYDSKSTAIRLITYSNRLHIAFAMNKKNKLRSIYLSVGDTIPKVSFPKWKGVNIEVVKLPDYGIDEFFVAMKELPNSTEYIFESVAEDLRKSIEKAKESSEALGAVNAVLAKWKNFFQYDGEILLSDIRQQGLMGELLFLNETVQKIGIYAIAKWAGSNEETHDFYFHDHAVEIKTTSVKEPYRAHISSEYQLDTNDVVGNLYLKFYALRKSQSTGVTLPQMVQKIRELLGNYPTMQMQFNDKLHKYGYYDEVSEIYTTGYYIRAEYQFRVQDGFPCIESRMINKGISNVEYSIDIDYCAKYTVENTNMLSALRGGSEDA